MSGGSDDGCRPIAFHRLRAHAGMLVLVAGLLIWALRLREWTGRRSCTHRARPPSRPGRNRGRPDMTGPSILPRLAGQRGIHEHLISASVQRRLVGSAAQIGARLRFIAAADDGSGI